MNSECDKLDAYLADDLPVGAASQFVRHLGQCAICREAVEQQRWIDALLSSDERAVLEPLPTALRESPSAALARRRQTGRLIACVLAAAATLATVAAGWTLKLNRQADGSRELVTNNVAAHVNHINANSHNVVRQRATFVSNGDTIAVPLESADADVTIVQLYPTTETERRTKNELALELLYSESNGG